MVATRVKMDDIRMRKRGTTNVPTLLAWNTNRDFWKSGAKSIIGQCEYSYLDCPLSRLHGIAESVLERKVWINRNATIDDELLPSTIHMESTKLLQETKFKHIAQIRRNFAGKFSVIVCAIFSAKLKPRSTWHSDCCIWPIAISDHSADLSNSNLQDYDELC